MTGKAARSWKGFPAHTWDRAVASIAALAAREPHVAPMLAFAETLAASRYAKGLHPIASLDRLFLSPNDHLGTHQEEVLIRREGGQFVISYKGSPTAATWEKAGPDGMALLERFLHHVRWFVEYHEDPEPGAG